MKGWHSQFIVTVSEKLSQELDKVTIAFSEGHCKYAEMDDAIRLLHRMPKRLQKLTKMVEESINTSQ